MSLFLIWPPLWSHICWWLLFLWLGWPSAPSVWQAPQRWLSCGVSMSVPWGAPAPECGPSRSGSAYSNHVPAAPPCNPTDFQSSTSGLTCVRILSSSPLPGDGEKSHTVNLCSPSHLGPQECPQTLVLVLSAPASLKDNSKPSLLSSSTPVNLTFSLSL